MKKYFFLLVLCYTCTNSSAQNLVVNPGLENYITCPGFGQFGLTFINNWTKPSWGSTDYYHTACPGLYPVSQAPHSGNAYLGLIAYNYGTEYREYATGELIAPLVAGTLYDVNFYVSLNDGYIQGIKELGAYFSAAVPGPYANALHIPVTPQIVNPTGILGDTASWVLVSGTFTASGGEQYITIGNFETDSATTIAMVGSIGSYGAYYFVDDISVTAVPEGIAEWDEGTISVFPTLSHGLYNLEIRNSTSPNMVYEITDYTGRKVATGSFEITTSNFETQLNLTSLSNGIYFFSVISNTNKQIFKIMKQ